MLATLKEEMRKNGEKGAVTLELNSTVRTKDGGRLYQQYRYRAQLLCMKGDGNQVETSTNELPRNLYILYRKYRINKEARIA